MVCPACGTPFDGRFCPACGREAAPPGPPPPTRVSSTDVPPPPPPPPWVGYGSACGRCGATFTGSWCPVCGTAAAGTRLTGVRAAGSVVWTVSMIAFFVLLAANLAALAYASWLMINGGGPYPIPLYVLAPFPVGEEVRTDAPTFFLYFSLIVLGILAAYAWYGVKDAKPTAEAFRRPLDHLRARLESRSAWIATGQVFLATFFFQVVYILALEGLGFVPSAPPTAVGDYPWWYDYFALANASVYEEIVTRVAFIGVPLAIAAAVLRSRPAGPGGPRTPAWRHLFGGTLNRNSAPRLVAFALVLILVSAVVFGLAHTPAWGAWKFVPALVAGLGMGYLFVRRGLLAAILFHFATDYLAALLLLVSDPLSVSITPAQVLLAVFVFALVGLGLFFFLWYLRYAQEVWRDLVTAWGFRRAAPVPGPPPTWAAGAVPPDSPPPPSPAIPGMAPPAFAGSIPAFGPAWIPYACPRCGWREARYDSNGFTCLLCGHASR